MHWLIGAMFVLVLAVVLNMGLLAYSMYALVGLMVLSRVLADKWSAHLAATRELNCDEVKIGDTVAVVVTLQNKSWLPIPWLLLEDLLPRRALMFSPPNLQVKGRRLQLVSFRGQSRKTVLYQIQCNRRGYYQIGPLVAETGDVFGLYRRYRVLSEPSYLLVYPQVLPMAGFDIASKRPIGEVRMTYRLFEDPTRIVGVREYQAGDALNRIHWGATASTGQLHSKIYEPSTVAGATLLVDFHQQSLNPKHEPVRSDLLVTAAASVAGALCQMGQPVGLVTNGRDAADRIRHEQPQSEPLFSRRRARSAGMREESHRLRPIVVPTTQSPAQLTRILEVLARVEQTDGLTLSELIREAASRLPRSSTVIALLTKVTPQAAIALGNLRRQGYAVSAIINVYEPYEFAEYSAMLLAERVETRHLRDKDSISYICAKSVVH